MKFTNPTSHGTIIKRYKRFLVDLTLDNGDEITAHLANTGSMKTCWEPGWKTLLTFHDNPKRKLKHSVELIHNGVSWIGVNTSITNKLAIEALERGKISELKGYDKITPESKVGNSRLDLFLEGEGLPPCYVEIKNVTLINDKGYACFPDAVTTRGQKHLKELMDLKSKGFRVAMLYVIQREDTKGFEVAADIDPEYARLLSEAKKCGVEILAYQCKLTDTEVTIDKKA